MTQDILINWSPQETRVAVVEHGAVQEVHIERALERGLYRADDIVAAVNLDAIGKQYPKGQTGPDTPFGTVSARLVRKAAQEALDGVVK